MCMNIYLSWFLFFSRGAWLDERARKDARLAQAWERDQARNATAAAVAAPPDAV